MRHVDRRQAGAAMVLVLLGIFILVAIGVFIILAVDRNTDMRAAYQRNVAGFNAAEAGLNVGAAQVLNAMQGFSLPTNCNPQSFTLNGRTVTYTLSVPGNAPGDCTPSTTVMTEPDGPYAGLNAIVHQYTLTARATRTLAARTVTEASITNQFLANLIPVFQFASFYSGDLEILPSPPMVINGRVHTNGNLYLNSDSCGGSITAGLNVLGNITIVGNLFRGRHDSSQAWNNVYVSLDGTPGNMKVLGATGPDDPGCAEGPTRQVGADEIAEFPGRITTGITGITLPGVDSLLCTPWVSGCGAADGAYWQNANLRIVLDLTAAPEHLDPSATPSGPQLPPIRVLNPNGSVNAAATDNLHQFMRDEPGALTYSDVPRSDAMWDCQGAGGASCENSTYKQWNKYAQPFPRNGTDNCTADRDPRQTITAANYCFDYRDGGFYNWREKKPIQILNLDWTALEEYNRSRGNLLYDPNAVANGGLVVFLAVKGPKSSAGNNYGVRIYDAARLPRDAGNSGVTFASDNAAYVLGNFNCPAPDTSGGDTVPAACGPGKRPSSVIADTVNVLSCAWIDVNPVSSPVACATYATGSDQWAGVGALRPLDERSTDQTGPCSSGCDAAQTFVSAAFLAGNDTTVGGLYSGGLENFPRFHENWQAGGPYRYWYDGSYVSLATPQHSCFSVVELGVADDTDFSCTTYSVGEQGFWGAQRYVPPPRRWFYDVSFNNSTNLPPLTPRFVFLKLVYFTQVFQ